MLWQGGQANQASGKRRGEVAEGKPGGRHSFAGAKCRSSRSSPTATEGQHSKSAKAPAYLLDGGPDAMHIIVLFERLKKFSRLGTMFVAECREGLSHIPDLAGDNLPSVLLEP